MSRPAVKLSSLRYIGWTCWDPIGLADQVGPELNSGPADEYDSYLLAAFGMAQRGSSEVDIASYLSDIASAHMGLGQSLAGEQAALQAASQLLILAEALT